MRVLEIAASLKIGGAEKIAHDIGFYLDSDFYQIDYVVFGDEIGEYEGELIKKGCNVYHLSQPSSSYINYLKELYRLIKGNRYNVVHAHTMFNSGWAMLIAKMCGVPIRISHSHSVDAQPDKSRIQRLYEKVMQLIIINFSTHYVGCGIKAGEILFGKTRYHKKGVTILNGIDTKKFAYSEIYREEIRKNLKVTDNFVIGHVGHLAEVKNQSFLINLMPEILKKKSNAKLLFLGEGEDRQKLEKQIIDLGLSGKIIMTGNVTDVHKYLSAMDTFVFPSLYEGMPLSVIEVQTNGLPCVMSDNVPQDVVLTDLIRRLSLNDSADMWVEAICDSERLTSYKYEKIIENLGLDSKKMVNKIADIYCGI
ncbi:MAG: glycosyltransferase family 1 protein [Clostridia bacterium]|nr:glycosyltransferase family 1 protein [Clostridia bacterium]